MFVPPPADDMLHGLSDWEHFVNGELGDIPPLVACGLMHYQFETLHPFLDGNGRIGRLLIVFYLVTNGHLPAPLLYLSSYFDEHKTMYYDRLQAVRERGEIEAWLQFFLTAVQVQATDAQQRAERLIDIQEEYRERLRGDRSRAGEVIDVLIQNPIVTTGSVSGALGITVQGAINLLNRLERTGVLTPSARIPGRSKRWICSEVFEALDA